MSAGLHCIADVQTSARFYAWLDAWGEG